MVALTPALGLIVFLGLEERETARENAQEETESLAFLAAGQYAETREGVRQLLATLTTSAPAFTGDDCDQAVGKLLDDFPQYHNIGIANPLGDIVCSGIVSATPMNIADRGFFEEAVSTGRFTEGEFQLGRLTGLPSIGFAYPFIHNGPNPCVAIATVDLAWLGRAVGGSFLPDGVRATLFDRNGTVLAAYPEQPELVGQRYDDSAWLMTAARGGVSVLGPSSPGAPDQLQAVVHMGDDVSGAYLTVSYPVSLAYAEANSRFVRNMGLLLAAGVLAMAAGWFFGEALLVRPARQLLRLSRRIEAGDLEARSEAQPIGRELSELAQRFDRMASQLETRSDLLHAERDNLRVVTADLSKHVDQLRSLHQVFTNVMQQLSTEEVVNSALQEALRLVQADVVVLRLLKGDRLAVAGALGAEESGVDIESIQAGEGLMGRVATQRQPIRIDRNVRAQFSPGQTIPDAESGIGVPVMVGDRLLGTLGCWSQREAAFSLEDERVLEMLASLIATAIIAAETAEVSELQARTDVLTGLANRRQMTEDFSQDNPQAAGSARFVVAMVDIDHFKLFNDRHGHDFGDEVLRSTAAQIKALIRDDDKVYRFGGEEFIVVFDNADGEVGVRLAERIRAGVSETQIHRDTTDLVTVSVGVCCVPQDCGDFLTAVRLADRAMYHSKHSGRNRVTLWSEIAAMAAA